MRLSRACVAGSGMRLVGGVRCQHTGNIHARILASQEFHQDGIHLKDGEDNMFACYSTVYMRLTCEGESVNAKARSLYLS